MSLQEPGEHHFAFNGQLLQCQSNQHKGLGLSKGSVPILCSPSGVCLWLFVPWVWIAHGCSVCKSQKLRVGSMCNLL